MILLDTNVLSELTKPQPSLRVLTWLRAVPSAEIYTSSITQAEAFLGLKQLPDGKRKNGLTRGTEQLFEGILKDRVLPFDSAAAIYYPEIILLRRAAGRPIQTADAMIAAIAIAHGYAVATRNVRDFADTGASVVNPFEDGAP